MIFVTLPEGFVATRFPGYFWNIETKTLYTAKLGVLRPLPVCKPNPFNHFREDGYRVSHQGKKRFLSLSYLERLKPKPTVFPVVKT